MNKQTFQLLKDLLHNVDYILSDEYVMEKYKVSSRSLYNYWSEIEEFLSIFKMNPLISFDGHYFTFLGTEKDKNYLYLSMSSLTFYEYKLSKEERINLILAVLADEVQPVKLEYLEKMFYVSKNTISSDIEECKKMLDTFHVSLNEKKHFGIQLSCSENKRREILFHTLSNLDASNEYFISQPCNPCITFIISYLRIERYKTKVEEVFNTALSHSQLSFSDSDYYQLLLVLLICLSRYRKGYYLSESTGSPSISANASFIALTDELYSSLFGSLFLKEEKNFFILVSHSMHIIYKLSLFENNTQYIISLVNELLLKLQKIYTVPFLKDSTLVKYLNAHILACYHRVLNGEKLNNCYLKDIKVNYANDFSILKDQIYILENGLNISLDDNEISYILMHILASIERMQPRSHALRVIICCSSGYATGNLLASLIKKNFGFTILSITSMHSLAAEIENTHPDLVISSIPLELPEVPHITVNALLSDKDIVRIKRKVNELESTKNLLFPSSEKQIETISNYSSYSLDSMLDKDMIALDKDASNWQEAIIAVGELLLWNKCITVNYMQQMIDLVAKYGPYIVITPGIALAHASSKDGVLKSRISIVRLRHPVVFGKQEFDPVHVVIGIATEDTPEFTGALLKLMGIIRNPNFLQEVLHAKTDEEILHLLNQ